MGARKRWGYARQVNGSARPRLFPGEKFHIGLEKWTACAVATGLAPYIPALKDRVLRPVGIRRQICRKLHALGRQTVTCGMSPSGCGRWFPVLRLHPFHTLSGEPGPDIRSTGSGEPRGSAETVPGCREPRRLGTGGHLCGDRSLGVPCDQHTNHVTQAPLEEHLGRRKPATFFYAIRWRRGDAEGNAQWF